MQLLRCFLSNKSLINSRFTRMLVWNKANAGIFTNEQQKAEFVKRVRLLDYWQRCSDDIIENAFHRSKLILMLDKRLAMQINSIEQKTSELRMCGYEELREIILPYGLGIGTSIYQPIHYFNGGKNFLKRILDVLTKIKEAAIGNEGDNKSSAEKDNSKEKEENEFFVTKRQWLEQQIDEEGNPKHFFDLELKTWRPEFAKIRLYSHSKAEEEVFKLRELLELRELGKFDGNPQQKILDLARGCPRSEKYLSICFYKALEFECYTVAEGMLRIWLHQMDPTDEYIIRQRSGIKRTFRANRKMTLLEYVDKLDERMFDNIDKLFKTYSQKQPTCHQITDLVEAAKQEEKRRKQEFTCAEIYNTLAIEGGILTFKEVTKVIKGEVKSLPGINQLEIEDALGMKRAIEYLVELRKSKEKMELEHLCKVHGHVMQGRDEKDPGQLRTVDVYIGGVPFVPCQHSKVEAEMGKVFHFMHNKLEGMHPIEYAALLHYIFVHVHPFRDGNGRVGRLLLNFALRSMGYPPIIVPVDRRSEYMESIYFANMGDARRLIRFFAEIMEKTLKNWIENGDFSTLLWDTPYGYTVDLPDGY